MSPAAGVLFTTVLAVAVATPGPSTVALVARVLACGLRGVGRLCVGLLLGDLFWLLCALLGVAALAQHFGGLFAAIRYAGVAYLSWLAWKLWRAAPVASPIEGERESPRPLLTGLALALGNPKTMLFYIALLPGIVSLDTLSLRDALILAALVIAVVLGVLAAYALLAERLRHHLHSPAALRRVNRSSALLMVGAAGAIATR
jgi:threonine/homoserine/homoserine lactone efflux protein